MPRLEPQATNIESMNVWARAAGILFLWLIVAGVAGSLLVSRATGSGDLPQIVHHVAGSEQLYRLGLVLELLETLSALLLAFCLFQLLRNHGPAIAALALLWRAAEGILGCIGIIFGFARLRIYLVLGGAGAAATSQAASQGAIDLTKYAGNSAYLIGIICFAIGSGLYFYLFRRTNLLPKVLSVIGIAASIIVAAIGVISMLFPSEATRLQYGWAPMAIAEVGAGLWLIAFGARARGNARGADAPAQ